jgi:hypothetical protein
MILTDETGSLPCTPPPQGYGRFGIVGANLNIPPLVLEPDVEIRPNGGTMAGFLYEYPVTLITDRTNTEMAADFQAQLNTAGWTLLGAGSSAHLAWSLWNAPGEGVWRVLVLTYDVPGERRHEALLRAEQVREESGLRAPDR